MDSPVWLHRNPHVYLISLICSWEIKKLGAPPQSASPVAQSKFLCKSQLTAILNTCNTRVVSELPGSLNPLGLHAIELASATLIQTMLLAIPWSLLLWSLRNQSPVMVSWFSWDTHSLILTLWTHGASFPFCSSRLRAWSLPKMDRAAGTSTAARLAPKSTIAFGLYGWPLSLQE